MRSWQRANPSQLCEVYCTLRSECLRGGTNNFQLFPCDSWSFFAWLFLWTSFGVGGLLNTTRSDSDMIFVQCYGSFNRSFPTTACPTTTLWTSFGRGIGWSSRRLTGTAIRWDLDITIRNRDRIWENQRNAQIYRIMTHCWSFQPRMMPSFR